MINNWGQFPLFSVYLRFKLQGDIDLFCIQWDAGRCEYDIKGNLKGAKKAMTQQMQMVIHSCGGNWAALLTSASLWSGFPSSQFISVPLSLAVQLTCVSYRQMHAENKTNVSILA